MKRYLGGCIVFLLCGLVIAGGILGWDRTDVQVTGKTFTPNQVRIPAGDSVYFQNQTGHGGVILCLGKKGVCASHASGPTILQRGGVTLEADEMLPIAFNDSGVYAITSPQHASMTLVVTVEKSSGGGYQTGGGSSGTGGNGSDGDSSGGGGGEGGGGGGE